MKKSICQSINVISCYANEIEMKSFNTKVKKESQKGEGVKPQNPGGHFFCFF